MAKKGLVRVPFYPQLQVLSPLHPDAPLVMSVLLFWMARNSEPTFCEVRHNYQMALHLGLSLERFTQCLEVLKAQGLFLNHEIVIPPKEVTATSKDKIETRLTLNFAALEALLQQPAQGAFAQQSTFAERGTAELNAAESQVGAAPLKMPECPISTKLLQHAADDSFDFYDVIDEKFLPVTQGLSGVIAGEDFNQAALLTAQVMVYLNEYHEELALKAIAPGWKLLLAIPLGQRWQEYAQELVVRFLRSGERAIDLNFTDGNFFLPDNDEIKTPQHIVKHFGKKTEPRVVTSMLLLLLAAALPQRLAFFSELSISALRPALLLAAQMSQALQLEVQWEACCGQLYFHKRRLNPQELQSEQQAWQQVLAEINNLQSSPQQHQQQQ